MACGSLSTGNEEALRFLDSLQNDLKNLSIETRKKFPQIKESCEEGIAKLRNAAAHPQTPVYYVVNQILYPLVQGCETKDPKIVKLCLGIMQRLMTQQAVDQKGARYITDTLWMLMESGTEEVKVLQSVTLLLTTNTVVHGDTLARNLVLCFRLHFTKDSTTINTAGATVRQLVSLVFERVVAEDEAYYDRDTGVQKDINLEELKVPSNVAPKGLRLCAADAYLMFQDLVQLVNADQPYWLIGMTEMTRTFGLELLESVLTNFSSVFYQHPEFSFLLKERVCALVIKLFSPNIKYRSSVPQSIQQATPLDKPYFPISMRLLRVVSILIQKYHSLLVTECEIFLSLIVKFLDPDKPAWQRSLALEVLHKMTVQPELLKSFCECYDLKAHATNIFQDIVNSLGAYVQSLFVNPQLMGQASVSGAAVPVAQGQPPALLAGMPVGPGVSPQPGFFSRGVWLPVVATFSSGQARATYLEMLDKIEPPVIPDGYGISVAIACLLDIIRSVAIIIEGTPPAVEEQPAPGKYSGSEEEKVLHCQLINSSWCGLLAALSPLIDASTDESASENVLKAIQTFASLCGMLDLQIPRDAFITAICKASLPPHYALTILNSAPQGAGSGRGHSRTSSQDMNSQYNVSAYNETDFRQQVVAVGTPLPTASLPIGAQQGPVMLTAKNLQCMRALLSVAHCHGSILGTSWHLVLTTLQHLVWILGLKPSTGGSLKAGRTTADSNAVITTAVMADLPVLSAMLSRLFESSQYLDDVALHHLIDALCKLSHEAMELAYSNREPSLFAVAKLLETGLVNLPRVEVLWRPLTNHLLEVCQHPHIRMREWGVEAITYLVKAAMQHKYQPPLRENQKLQTLLLGPLSELSSVPHGDVRQRQLECVLHVLHGAGETLSHGWPLVLGIIGAVSDHHGENLIRIAFQCLQLVVTDFLPVMPWRCLPLCVDTAAKFGSQTQELNISLTAVGLMWNISDYFFQNQDKLCQSLTGDNTVFPNFPGISDLPHFDKLWMCLYSRLGDLCVDSRPAVRKSAGQTLFSTISAHGGLLSQITWQSIVWQVLFPLLDNVRRLSSSASSEKVDTGGNILIHHSRNTAQKQWAETQVLTLSGVARVFNTKRQILRAVPGDFPRAWSLLLEFIENSALSKNDEVSLAALKAFQDILYWNQDSEGKLVTVNQATVTNEEPDIWDVAWKVWCNIGAESTKLCFDVKEFYVPSQPFLTALIQIFPAVFQHTRERFSTTDLLKLCEILQNAVAIPVLGDISPFVLPIVSDAGLTQLQEGVLHCIELLKKEALTGQKNMKKMIAPIFDQLLAFSKYACQPPVFGKADTKNGTQVKGAAMGEWMAVNYIPFGEKALTMAIELYRITASDMSVINACVLHKIICALHVPLSMKYSCPSPTTWKLAVTGLLTVLQIGLPLARKHRQEFQQMWPQLAETLDKFLFPTSHLARRCVGFHCCQHVTTRDLERRRSIGSRESVLSRSATVSVPRHVVTTVTGLAAGGARWTAPTCDRCPEELQADEAVDCKVIELLRDEVLPHVHSIQKEFILKVVVLLNKGSIHSASSPSSDYVAEPKLREEFAKTCFETLLQFSLQDGADECAEEITEGGVAGRLAVTALLTRFQEVLHQYVEDERKNGNCPLPRYRLSEISFVLKAVGTLVLSLKKAPPGKVNESSWEQLIALYPYLVDCTTTKSTQVSSSLREALLQYADLLHSPTRYHNGV
ncbi:protein MON2 homolog [Schistocerca piceifrons]|uniref:protein MON2 homolog n=1 Tax=Schistocerca piceifrons TaxID=274613 RepID=UPI001F5E6113|nr:protein MON2 homolog [Schistocerca piceifrons]